VVSAARLFEAAGAHVEPMQPWMSEEMLHGMDRFWRIRSGRRAGPAARAARQVLPIVRQWAEGGLGFSGEQAFAAYSMTFKTRCATVAATEPFDYVLSPVSPNTSFPPNGPTHQRRERRHGAHRLHRALQHERAAGRLGELRLRRPRRAHRPADRRAPLDDLGVLQLARAFEQMRPAQRPWPRIASPEGPAAWLGPAVADGLAGHAPPPRAGRLARGGGPAAGTAAMGLVAGVAMAHSGLPMAVLLPMSLLVYASSSQLACLPLIASQAPLWLIGLTAAAAEPALRGLQRRMEPLFPPPAPAAAHCAVVLRGRPHLCPVQPAPPLPGRHRASAGANWVFTSAWR
jgi:hypothetical protein